jgi:hypothetical protein
MTAAVQRAITAYRNLIARALRIAKGAPYWQHIRPWERPFLTFRLEGDDAVLAWPTTEYDEALLEEASCRFPATLLTLSDADLAAWKEQQDAIYRRQRADEEAASAAARERQERQALATLKAKYESA